MSVKSLSPKRSERPKGKADDEGRRRRTAVVRRGGLRNPTPPLGRAIGLGIGSKDQLRRHLSDLRGALDRTFVSETSRVIQRQVLSLNQFLVAKSVALYSAFRNEVETNYLYGELKRAGKRLVYPRFAQGQLEFFEVCDLSELKPSPWGMLEPVGKQPVLPVLIDDLDVVIIPGIAFDTKGYRVGFGYGCYDKALENFHGFKVGIAYDFQIVSDMAHDPWDVRCDWIVTEKRVIEKEGGEL